jgi:hypothetical protein
VSRAAVGTDTFVASNSTVELQAPLLRKRNRKCSARAVEPVATVFGKTHTNRLCENAAVFPPMLCFGHASVGSFDAI